MSRTDTLLWTLAHPTLCRQVHAGTGKVLATLTRDIDIDGSTPVFTDAECVRDALARARQEGIEQGRRERDAWKQLAEGLDALCVAYRTGTRRTPEKALDSIREARSILAAIRAQEPAHD